MGAYSDLQKIDINHAIEGMVDLVLDRGLKNKVLLVPIRLSASNYDKESHFGTEITVVIYRPTNYCFVGMVKGTPYDLKDGEDVHFEAYHDSCWRDGISRVIRKESKDVCERIEEAEAEDGIYIFNSFGMGHPRTIDGNIKMNHDDRTAEFTKQII